MSKGGRMKVSKEFFKKLEELYSQYEKEVPNTEKNENLKANTKKTYLLHNNNFMKWLKNDFKSKEKKDLKKLRELNKN